MAWSWPGTAPTPVLSVMALAAHVRSGAEAAVEVGGSCCTRSWSRVMRASGMEPVLRVVEKVPSASAR